MPYPTQLRNPLQDSAREWLKIQVAVLGFVGVCGLFGGEDEAFRPHWLSGLSAVAALAGLALALLSVVLTAGIGYPLTSRPIRPSTAYRRVTGGIVVTFVAVGVTALAALSGWWPHTERTEPLGASQVEVRTPTGSVCGSLLEISAGSVDLEVNGKLLTVPLSKSTSVEVSNACR